MFKDVSNADPLKHVFQSVKSNLFIGYSSKLHNYSNLLVFFFCIASIVFTMYITPIAKRGAILSLKKLTTL